MCQSCGTAAEKSWGHDNKQAHITELTVDAQVGGVFILKLLCEFRSHVIWRLVCDEKNFEHDVVLNGKPVQQVQD